jgi:hypothetical protein
MRREVRFGVRDGDRYSQYWTVRAAAKRADIYVASQRTGGFLHISVHDPAYGLHVKVDAPQGPVKHVLPHPEPLAPGVTRLVQLRVPKSAATYAAPTGRNVGWVAAPEDPEVWVSFEVLALAAEAFTEEEPAWMRGIVPIRMIERLDGSGVGIAARWIKGDAGSLTLPAQPGDRERIKAVLDSGGEVRALIEGVNPDGSLWFLELRTEAATASGVTKRPPRRPAGLPDALTPPEPGPATREADAPR